MDEIIEVSDDEVDGRTEGTSGVLKQDFFTHVADRNYNNQINSHSWAEDYGRNGEYLKYDQDYLRSDKLSREVKQEQDIRDDYIDTLSNKERVLLQDSDAKEIVHQFIDSHGKIWNNDAGSIDHCSKVMAIESHNSVAENWEILNTGNKKIQQKRTCDGYTANLSDSTNNDCVILRAGDFARVDVEKYRVEKDPIGLRQFQCNSSEHGAAEGENLRSGEDFVHFDFKRYICSKESNCVKNHLSLVNYQAGDNECHSSTVHQTEKKIDFFNSDFKRNICLCCDPNSNELNCVKNHLSLVNLQAEDNECHSGSVHPKKKIFKCQLCDYRPSSRHHLVAHVDAVHLKKKDHKCLTCNYAASTKSALKKHVDVIHLKSKNYDCDVCGFRAHIKSSIRKHIKNILRCDLCSYKTCKKLDLQLHVKAVHSKL